MNSKDTNIPALDSFTCIGKISKTHGYDGAVVLTLDVDNAEDFETLESVFVEFNGKLVPFFINKIAYAGKTNLRLSFLDYNSDKKIDEFIGCSLYLPDDCFPESDEEIDEGLSIFIGYTAIDVKTKKKIGTISDIIENPAHPLFEIVSNGKSYLIPAVEDFITAVNEEKQIIEFTLPEGLLDL